MGAIHLYLAYVRVHDQSLPHCFRQGGEHLLVVLQLGCDILLLYGYLDKLQDCILHLRQHSGAEPQVNSFELLDILVPCRFHCHLSLFDFQQWRQRRTKQSPASNQGLQNAQTNQNYSLRQIFEGVQEQRPTHGVLVQDV